ncbi:MAG: D-alanyl-D-alanine carboxypeptidase/D-alanyl-D-alanine-endopeptidase [Bryobacterales bacterium]|nr:D-alanyl-D-alanine carboxypeptidase/D-alanyl-D-alanine-endopeptidase [Bryobacterales bacterium]
MKLQCVCVLLAVLPVAAAEANRVAAPKKRPSKVAARSAKKSSKPPSKTVAKTVPPAPRLTTARRIDTLLATKEAQSARWGIQVRSLATGAIVYEHNPDQRLTPASNTKLFSSALAMTRLGPNHKFLTRIVATRRPDAEGRIDGDVRLLGGGDPTLSGRAYPYRKDDEGSNPVEPIEQLAAELIRLGVREIRGNIVGDDRLFIHAPYPEGWTIDDSLWEYGAPVSALPFNDNAFMLSIRPGEATGDLARLAVNPPSLPLWIDNRVVTAENGRSNVQVDRSPGSRQLRVTGTVSMKSNGVRQLLAVDDAALYAAHVFRDVLTQKGIAVRGVAEALHRTSVDEPLIEEGVELARRESPPLVEVARVVNKVSQNLHAEILLREVARVRRQEATREAGLKEMDTFLEEVGIKPDEVHFEDGSGLSRRTLLTASALVRLLTYMDRSPHREAWDTLLPVAGYDGTLARRFDQAEQARVIHAKTGTLATTNALSGYLTTRRGARLAFSIIANNHTVPSSEIRKVIDRIGIALLDWEGN